MFKLNAFRKKDLIPGLIFVIGMVVIANIQAFIYDKVDTEECSLENFAQDAATAWENHQLLPHTACYNRLFKNAGNGDFSRKYQREFESIIAKKHPRVGYKIGLHEKFQQKMFGLDGPVFGVFYGEDTWKESGSIIDVKGEYLGFEPDFLLRIGDERINQATTIEEASKSIDRVYAFIEFPAFITDPAKIHDAVLPNFYTLQALNLGARHGIIGDYIDTASDPNIIENLRNMTVLSTDHRGVSLRVRDLADDETHIYITAIMTAKFLKERGEKLKKGDLISVGALGQMGRGGPDWDYPGSDAKNTKKRHVHYYIGGERLSVSVGFEDSVRGISYEP